MEKCRREERQKKGGGRGEGRKYKVEEKQIGKETERRNGRGEKEIIKKDRKEEGLQ